MKCPCNSTKPFEECCQAVIAGSPAPTAESLMRSRYTAMVLGDLDHIERTCTEDARQTFNRPEMEHSLPGIEWLGLEVLGSERGQEGDDAGTVSFRFAYRFEGREHAQREIATFERTNGNWLYDRSEINPKAPPVRVERIGRNDPCPCGSGKKHKKCCGSSGGKAAA